MSHLILSIKSGGEASADFKIDVREINLVCDIAIGYLLGKNYFQNRTEGGFEIDGAFVRSFKNQKVYLDQSREEYYTDLPAKLISLPNDRGLVQMSGMVGQNKAFLRLPTPGNRVFSALEAGNMPDEIYYYLEGDRVYYKGIKTASRWIPEVLIKMVASVEDLDETAALPIPSSMSVEFIEIVKQILDEEKNTPIDDVNDNSNNNK